MSNNKHKKKSLDKHSCENCDNSHDKREPVSYEHHIEPPFWGTGEILTWEPKQLVDAINKDELFKKEAVDCIYPDDYETAKREVLEPFFEKYTKEIVDSQLINPRGFFGYFPVITDKETLILIDPSDFCTELAEFKFPRIDGGSWADYFNPDGDIIGFQVVTIGDKLTEKGSRLVSSANFDSPLDLNSDFMGSKFLDGLGCSMIDIMAKRVSVELARGIGLAPGFGARYSFGDYGMPPLHDLKNLFEILGIEERLGIYLTHNFEMIPKHSSVGIFIRNCEAEC
ncbi:MAG: vitamin B12 dependent-methionine synthase activation domain-containing protein [Fibrobacter sp.]|nr:vitamin B12 dependent-methionine synthase activation domain-containing protein [Fibrobacter sp.]